MGKKLSLADCSLLEGLLFTTEYYPEQIEKHPVIKVLLKINHFSLEIEIYNLEKYSAVLFTNGQVESSGPECHW